MAYLFIRGAGNLVSGAHEPYRMNGTDYLNVRAFLRDNAPGQIVASNAEYAAYGIYPVHFLPPPDHNPYRQHLVEQFHFNAGAQRIDRVLVVRTLSPQEAEALYADWTLPRHWVQWLIHRNNWDTWLSELQKQFAGSARNMVRRAKPYGRRDGYLSGLHPVFAPYRDESG